MAVQFITDAWDHARIGNGTFELSQGGGGPWTITLDGHYCHFNISFTVSSVSEFRAVLVTKLDATPDAGTYTVTFSFTTGKYTITRAPAANFELTFPATAAGLLARALLGFSGNKSGATSYVSDVQVTHFIFPPMDARSHVIPDDEDVVTEVSEADDGTTYSLSRTTAPLHYDFDLQFQTEALTFTRHAAATAPWTWQQFFDHVRGHEYFVSSDGGGTVPVLHKLRQDGTSFKEGVTRFQVEEDLNTYWHIKLMTYMLDRL